MDQVLVSVSCPPQNEHIDIKNVTSEALVILKGFEYAQKFHLLHLLRHSFLSRQFFKNY